MIRETFTKQQKRIASAGQQDVYQYEVLPPPFRMQVAYLWQTTIGRYYIPQTAFNLDRLSSSNQFWELIYNWTTREAGLPIIGRPQSPTDVRCIEHLLSASTSDALDIIQLSFQVIDNEARRLPVHRRTESAGITQTRRRYRRVKLPIPRAESGTNTSTVHWFE
jgi:hypothetical protein